MIDSTNPKVIGIWGGGLIGLSTAAHFARKKIRCVVYDIDKSQVDRINNSFFPVGFEEWTGFSISQYIQEGHIEAINDISLLPPEVKVHFIAVPTEKNGEPYMSAVKSVLRQLKSLSPYLCIIESTVVPGNTEKLGHKFDLPLGVATRRDWFTTSDKNLEHCTRIYAGVNDTITARMEPVISIVSRNLTRASSCTVVELTKCLDNGIFHTVAMYSSQIASSYPNKNTAEALKLAATHWRLGNHVYFPSIGTGGHCVPLANKYLLEGANHPSELSIAQSAVDYDASNPSKVAFSIASQLKSAGKVAVLGICYRGDIRVHIKSPHLALAKELVRLGVSVGINDPYYSDVELYQLSGCYPMKFPEDLKDFDYIYVGPNHELYKKRIFSVLAYMRKGQKILDNQGIWEDLAEDAKSLDIKYHRVGSPNWLPEDDTIIGNHHASHINGLNKQKNNSPEQVDDDVLFSTKYFKIKSIQDPRKLSPDPYYVLDRCDSVTMIITTPSNKFLIQKQYRAHVNLDSWEFPMGGIDLNETPTNAACRELKEETGITVEPPIMKKIGEYCPIPGLSTQVTYIFHAQISNEEIEKAIPAIDEGILSFKITSPQEFAYMIESNQVFDGFTLAAYTIWHSNKASINALF